MSIETAERAARADPADIRAKHHHLLELRRRGLELPTEQWTTVRVNEAKLHVFREYFFVEGHPAPWAHISACGRQLNGAGAGEKPIAPWSEVYCQKCRGTNTWVFASGGPFLSFQDSRPPAWMVERYGCWRGTDPKGRTVYLRRDPLWQVPHKEIERLELVEAPEPVAAEQLGLFAGGEA